MVNWDEIQRSLRPIPSYEELRKKWRDSLDYPVVREHYNLTMPELLEYTNHLLGEDTRGRYSDYLAFLTRSYLALQAAGVANVLELCDQIDTREKLEGFVALSGMDPVELIGVMKFLIYWFIPAKKPLGSTFKNDPRLTAAVNRLREGKIRTTLDLLEHGRTPQARRALAEGYGVPEDVLTELVNRADFSRMPWASSATISNIIGAGYPSIANLAAADLERVSEDFFRYGESIGKNLKFGNEIENSHRVARLVPRVLSGV